MLYHDEERTNVIKEAQEGEVYRISQEEIKAITKELPKGKACGSDNIPAELLQCLEGEGLDILTKLINKIYNSGQIPQDFRDSLFVPIPKLPRASDCSDYRTIALISHASKILLQLIKKRITPSIERQLSDSQMGFRKGKGTRDAIFQLRQIGERMAQMGKELVVCFVDYQKAFDRVSHDKLVEVMEKAELPELEMNLIRNLYWNQRASVRWDRNVSRPFEIQKEVRQGSIISPILFNLYSEFMITEALDEMEGVKFNGVNLTNLRYADDAVILAENEENLQKMMESLNNKCKEYGMAINAKKTMVMVIGAKAETKCNITIDGLALEQVKRYKYLGSWITEDVRCDTEVTTRIAMAKTAFWQNKEIMRRNVRHETKLKILNCYVFSVLNYGCESWTWTKALERKINAFEMWCYRRMLKISWMKRISNKEVLQRINCNLHFLKQMKKRKMDYAGHVMRG